MLSPARLDSLLSALPRLRIGLVGDLFLDRYLELAPGVIEHSIETGREAYQIATVRNVPGALGTVMNNLAALGVEQLVPVTVLGDDGHGYDLQLALRDSPVDLSYIVIDERRLTPTYTKPLRRGEHGQWQELNRLDIRSREPLHSETLGELIDHLQQVFASTDGVIVLDQVNEADWGVVHHTVREALSDLHLRHPEKLMFVDSRRHLGKFSRGVLKGNRAEILDAVGKPDSPQQDLNDALQRLASRTNEPVFCTVGEAGMLVAAPGADIAQIPGYQVTGPVDIVGAGDAATSGIVTALLTGHSLHEAAAFGNLVASITVQQLGTTGTASPDQLRARVNEST